MNTEELKYIIEIKETVAGISEKQDNLHEEVHRFFTILYGKGDGSQGGLLQEVRSNTGFIKQYEDDKRVTRKVIKGMIATAITAITAFLISRFRGE